MVLLDHEGHSPLGVSRVARCFLTGYFTVAPAGISLSPTRRNRRQSKCTIFVLKGDYRDEVILVIGVTAIVLASVLLAYLTYQQIGVWKNSLVILNYILAKEQRNSPHVYLYRGMALEKAGKLERALDDYNQAIELNERSADAYFDRGKLYYPSGQKERARADFQKSCDLGDASGCGALQDLSKEGMVPRK